MNMASRQTYIIVLLNKQSQLEREHSGKQTWAFSAQVSTASDDVALKNAFNNFRNNCSQHTVAITTLHSLCNVKPIKCQRFLAEKCHLNIRWRHTRLVNCHRPQNSGRLADRYWHTVRRLPSLLKSIMTKQSTRLRRVCMYTSKTHSNKNIL